MKRSAPLLRLILLYVVFSLVPAWTAVGVGGDYVEDAVPYTRYINTRYGFSIPYPSRLLVPQPPPGNNDGREFLSQDERVHMSAWGTYNVMEETLAGRMASEKGDPDRTVTYEAMKADWFVLSGYIEGRIFYQRTYLVDDIFYTFFIVYDEAVSDIYDPITAHISNEFSVPGAMK